MNSEVEKQFYVLNIENKLSDLLVKSTATFKACAL